jgi:hypothetical protein
MKHFMETKLQSSLFYRRFLSKNSSQKVENPQQVHTPTLQPPKYRLKSHGLSLLPFQVPNNQEYHIKCLFFDLNEWTNQNLQVLQYPKKQEDFLV